MEADSDSLLLELDDQRATERLGGALARRARRGDAFLLAGPFGAGKTVLARAFLRAAAGDPALLVPSPSYTLVQSYETPLGMVHHFDLWRLGDGAHPAEPAALAELGWEEALGDIVLVEWPERLGPIAPEHALHIVLRIVGDNARQARMSGEPERLRNLG